MMIQKIFTIGLLTWMILPAHAQSLDVVLTNVKSDQGHIRVALFSEENYLKKSIETKLVKAKTGEMKITFELVPAGVYAIHVLHDANANGEMDKSFIGIPKEGYAFSNNTGKFGAPDFKEASFTVSDQRAAVAVTLFYY